MLKPVSLRMGIDAIYHLIYSKANAWSYEDELRSLVTGLNKPDSRKISFKVDDINSIYLEVRCSNETKTKILGIVKTTYSNKLTVYEGIVSEDSFSIIWIKEPLNH